MTDGLIDTLDFSARLRAKAINTAGRQVMISRLEGSDQALDFTVPPNCGGFGRVRHFRQATSSGWPINPLPIVPAARALGLVPPPAMTAQVFQNAACNWRCWYCYVPYNLLAADPARSAWLTAEELVALYAAGEERPLVIDLSGGSPDLVPEWVPWMMGALDAAGLSKSTYLWSDDNLSTMYLFDQVPAADVERMQAYRGCKPKPQKIPSRPQGPVAATSATRATNLQTFSDPCRFGFTVPLRPVQSVQKSLKRPGASWV